MGKNISFVNVAELLIIQEDMKFMNGKKKVYDHRELEIKKNWDISTGTSNTSASIYSQELAAYK